MSIGRKARYLEIAAAYSLPVFFQPWWLDSVVEEWGAVFVEDEKGVQAVWVYAIEKKLGITLVRNPQLTPYLGPFFFHPENLSLAKRLLREEKLFSELYEQLPSWSFMDVMTVPSFENFLVFHHRGFSHSQRLTYYVDLSQEKRAILDNIHSKQRYAIRQAEKELQLVDAHPFTGQFYDFHRETFESKGRHYPYSKSLLENIITTAGERNQSYFKAVVTRNNEVAGIAFCVYDKQIMYLLLTATNKKARHNGAVALLIKEAFLYAKDAGIRFFDFEGSMDKGIEQFFRSFGGERKTYLHVRKNNSKIWKFREWLRK
ncbi:MAG TPA: GNAT family N-acetyltransferase [Flavipsychrobacter sp.]|nr:GNAT family N-acetyltransferase [Flavipsychrobacter sp.]